MRLVRVALIREGFGETHLPDVKAILGIMDAPRVAIRGGNCNNGGNAGFRYVNVNNAASNSNWNIGASPVSREMNIANTVHP